jgi:hypothetical protein
MKRITEKQFEALGMMHATPALRWGAVHPLTRNALTRKGLAQYREDRFVLTSTGRKIIEARLAEIIGAAS